ncbi:MAG: hypothetical protein KDE27_30310 [Planctomycetes bacterium]|nr:hypothetical protein [Planctomycetota bacterium]
MASKPRLTIVCLLQHRVLRADTFGGGQPPLVEVIDDAPADSQLALRAALQRQRPAGRVLVLDESAWTQTIELGEAAVAGLDPTELRRAIAYEIEPMSGLSPTASRLGLCEAVATTTGRRSFWICQIAETAARALEAEVAAAHARLLGITTPCGLGLAGAVDEGEARVEVWDGSTYCGTPERPELVIGARAGQRSWTQSIGDWLARRGDGTIAWSGAARPVAATTTPPTTLVDHGPLPATGDPEAAGVWLAAVAGVLERAGLRLLPTVAPSARPLKIRAAVVALVLALATALLLAYDDHRLRAALPDLVTRLETAQRERQQIQARRRATDAELRQLAEHEAETAALVTAIDGIEVLWRQQQEHVEQLLRSLAAVRPRGVMLRSVDTVAGGVTEISGIGVEPKSVDEFAAELAAALRSGGWEVRPAQSSERRTPDGHALYDFSIGVAPEGRAVARPASARKRAP